MKDNDSSFDELLNDVLSSESLERFRTDSLETALIVVRKRRRRRRARQALLMVAVPLVLAGYVFVSNFYPNPGSPSSPTNANQSTSILQNNASSTASPTPGIEYISDEELLELFEDRPVALIGPPGEQELVLLDEVDNPPLSD